VVDELRRLNPKNEHGNRRARHHKFLSDDIGHPHLQQQITATTTLMRAAEDWPSFKRMFTRAFPRTGDQLGLSLGD
jgi:hypothetical protein